MSAQGDPGEYVAALRRVKEPNSARPPADGSPADSTPGTLAVAGGREERDGGSAALVRPPT
jgi:hypothetical protein